MERPIFMYEEESQADKLARKSKESPVFPIGKHIIYIFKIEIFPNTYFVLCSNRWPSDSSWFWCLQVQQKRENEYKCIFNAIACWCTRNCCRRFIPWVTLLND